MLWLYLDLYRTAYDINSSPIWLPIKAGLILNTFFKLLILVMSNQHHQYHTGRQILLYSFMAVYQALLCNTANPKGFTFNALTAFENRMFSHLSLTCCPFVCVCVVWCNVVCVRFNLRNNSACWFPRPQLWHRWWCMLSATCQILCTWCAQYYVYSPGLAIVSWSLQCAGVLIGRLACKVCSDWIILCTPSSCWCFDLLTGSMCQNRSFFFSWVTIHLS